MEPQKISQKQLLVTGIAIIVIIILAISYWYVSQEQKEEASQTAENANQALEIFSESVVTGEDIISNPVQDKIPELNPVEKTNPYKEYTNPFE